MICAGWARREGERCRLGSPWQWIGGAAWQKTAVSVVSWSMEERAVASSDAAVSRSENREIVVLGEVVMEMKLQGGRLMVVV